MNNVDKVRQVYASFGKGDVPAILEILAEDIDWEYAYPDRGVPWLLPRRGRAAVGEFFAAAAEHLAFTRFEVTNVLDGGTLVAAICSVAATVKKTGKSFDESEEVHLWTFDPKGRVVRFRHVVDTFAHVAAWRG